MKKFLTSKSKYFFLATGLMFNNMLMAQGAAGQIETWGENVNLALNACVAVFAIVGGFLIFLQYMQGNEQAQKNFIKFVIGLAIFGMVKLIAGEFLPAA